MRKEKTTTGYIYIINPDESDYQPMRKPKDPNERPMTSVNFGNWYVVFPSHGKLGITNDSDRIDLLTENLIYLQGSGYFVKHELSKLMKQIVHEPDTEPEPEESEEHEINPIETESEEDDLDKYLETYGGSM